MLAEISRLTVSITMLTAAIAVSHRNPTVRPIRFAGRFFVAHKYSEDREKEREREREGNQNFLFRFPILPILARDSGSGRVCTDRV